MKNEIKKNLKLLIPKYELNDRTTKRVAMFSIFIPFIFGCLAIWFTYTKVSNSERKYSDTFKKLADSRQKLNELKTELEKSQANISFSDKRLQQIEADYAKAASRLRDSLSLQKTNMLSLKYAVDVAQKNYHLMQDSNRIQNNLLQQNKEQINASSDVLKRLNDSLESMKKFYRLSKDSLEFAKADVVMMKNSMQNAQGQAAKIKPEARSRTIFGGKDLKGRPLFDFAVWLDVPKEVKKDIVDVTYKYNLPTDETGVMVSNLKSETIVNPKNDYKTTFISWGCVSNMVIEVRFNTGVTTPLYFDVCRFLDNPLLEKMP